MTDASKDPILRGIIERQKTTVARGVVYRDNSEGVRAAYLLPDTGSPSAFEPDPDGVNLKGGLSARYVFQTRIKAEPTQLVPPSASRVGAWNSLVWDAPDDAPADKAVFYGWYFTAKGFQGDAAQPQSNSVLVVRGETAAGQAHGKTEGLVIAAAHERVAAASEEDGHAIVTEDGDHLADETGSALLEEAAGEGYVFTNGKLVCNQNVLVFDGPDVGWIYDPDDDDEESDGTLASEVATDGVRNLYPGYGTSWNNAGLTPGFAAGIVKSRKPPPDGTGVPWTHGHYIKKYSVSAFAYRYQKHFGVCAVGFDPGDGSGARAMPYLGLGTDVAATPLHLKGPVTLEQRLEYAPDAVVGPYQLGGLSFYGRSDATAQTRKMAELRVDVSDPTLGSETAGLTLAARVDGRTKDRLHVGEGVWLHGAAGGDMGAGALNVSSLFVDGELALGEDPDAADPVVAVGVVQNAKGMVIKSTTPTDRRFRGVQLYRSLDIDDPAAATRLDAYPARPSKDGDGKTLKVVDTDALSSGHSYFYYEASLSKLGVESGLRVRIGSAVYKGVQGADIEGGAVDFATHVSGATKPANNATVGATAGTDLRDATGAVLGNAEVVNGQATFAPRKRWAFKNSLQGWTLSNGTSSLGAAFVTITGNAANQLSLFQLLSYPGGDTFKVRVRLRPKQTIGAGQWSGRCFWQTAGHGFDPSLYRRSLPLPANWAVNEWRVLEWDMSSPTVGGSDWIDNTITGIAVDFTQVAGLAFDVAWIAIGDDSLDPVDLRGVSDGATRNITYRQPTAPTGGAYAIGDHWINTSPSVPRVHSVWDGTAWEAVGRNTVTTYDLGDAGGCARLNPSDLFDYPAVNPSGGVYTSPVTGLNLLTYGVDRPALSVKNTSVSDYSITLTGGSSGDRIEIANRENGTGRVAVTGDSLYYLYPGQEGVFIGSPTGFALRQSRVLCDISTRIIPPAMIPMGGAGKAQAWSANLDAVAALTSPASLITGAGQTGSANSWSGRQTMSAGAAVTGGMFNLGAPAALTIVSDAITVTTSSVSVETQGGAATDDLSTINGGASGDLLIVKATTTGHSVVLKDGVGNLQLNGDCTLATVQQRIVLIFQGSNWVELSRSLN